MNQMRLVSEEVQHANERAPCRLDLPTGTSVGLVSQAFKDAVYGPTHDEDEAAAKAMKSASSQAQAKRKAETSAEVLKAAESTDWPAAVRNGTVRAHDQRARVEPEADRQKQNRWRAGPTPPMCTRVTVVGQ